MEDRKICGSCGGQTSNEIGYGRRCKCLKSTYIGVGIDRLIGDPTFD